MRNWLKFWWLCCRVMAWKPPEGMKCLVCIEPRQRYLGVTLKLCCIEVPASILVLAKPRHVLARLGQIAADLQREYERRHPGAGHVLDTSTIGKDA